MTEYERHRKEAVRLHDLGRYNEAVQSCLEARKYQYHPSLVMLIISSRLLQGRLREAIAEIDSVGHIDAFARDDELNCVGLKMICARRLPPIHVLHSNYQDIDPAP